MTSPRRLRILFTGILALAVSGVLSACVGPSPRGTVAPEFEEFLTEQPGVTSASVGVSTPLPFGGQLSATVTLEETVSDEGIRDLLHDVATEVTEWRNRTSNVSFTVDVHRGPDVVAVLASREANDDVADLLIAARATPGVVAVDLAGFATAYTLATAEHLVATFDALLDSQLSFAAFAEADLAVGDADDGFSISAHDGRPDSGIAVFEAVQAAVPVVGARISSRQVELRLAAESDIPIARALAEPLWTGAPDDLLIQGGIVTRTGGGDFGTVDPVIAAAVQVPGVVSIRAESDGLHVRVEGFGVVAPLRAAFAEVAETRRLRYVSIVSQIANPGFQLYGAGDASGDRDAVVEALLGEPYLASIASREINDSFHIETGPLDPGSLAAFAAALRAALPLGSEVQLETADSAEGFGIRFRVAARLAPADVDQFRGDSAAAFLDGWNGS